MNTAHFFLNSLIGPPLKACDRSKGGQIDAYFVCKTVPAAELIKVIYNVAGNKPDIM
jgi:hypothetical protein